MAHLSRIWTLACATFTQLLRMRIMAFLAVFCVIVVAAGLGFAIINPEQQLKLLKDVAFGALQVFSVVMGICATALLLPRDLEDRTLYTVLAKPVPRLNYLLGKLLGVLMTIAVGMLVLDLALSLMLYLRQNLVFAQAVAALKAEGQDSPQAVAQLQAMVAQQGLGWNLQAGVLVIFLKSSVITAMTLMISCMASSTLFTMVIGFLATLCGHGQELIRETFLSGQGVALRQVWKTLLAVITPDLTLFDVTDAVINGQSLGMPALLGIAGMSLLYVLGYAMASHLLFVEKEL